MGLISATVPDYFPALQLLCNFQNMCIIVLPPPDCMVKWLEHPTCSREVRGSTSGPVILKTLKMEPTAIVLGAQCVSIGVGKTSQ